MTLTPRRTEIDAVAAVLNSGEYESSGEMATAVIKVVAEQLSLRNSVGLAVGSDPKSPFLAVGPFYNKRDIDKAISEAQEVGLTAIEHRLTGTAWVKAPAGRRRPCGCGHPVEMHPKANRCLVQTKEGMCGCEAFVRGTPASDL